jgi:hypothetical protein
VDPVGPHVDEVALGQVPLGEGPGLGLPLGRQPGDHRGAQPGGGAEEPRQRRSEVAGAHPVQVHQRQDLGHLGALAGPRRQDRRPEPAPLPGLVHALVVHPGSRHVDPTGGGGDGSRLSMAVAHHQSPAPFVSLVGQPSDVGVHLGLEGGGEHPPGTVEDDLVERRAHLRPGVVIGHYSQHRRPFLTGAPTPVASRFGQRGRYVPSASGWPIPCPAAVTRRPSNRSASRSSRPPRNVAVGGEPPVHRHHRRAPSRVPHGREAVIARCRLHKENVMDHLPRRNGRGCAAQAARRVGQPGCVVTLEEPHPSSSSCSTGPGGTLSSGRPPPTAHKQRLMTCN